MSFLPQPAKEEKVEETAEKSPEEAQATTEGEGAEEQKEAEGEEEAAAAADEEGQTSIFQSPLRLVRKSKMKLVVCHVSLLDGTDFTCEVEVRASNTSTLTDDLTFPVLSQWRPDSHS